MSVPVERHTLVEHTRGVQRNPLVFTLSCCNGGPNPGGGGMMFGNARQCVQCADGDFNQTNEPVNAQGISVTNGVVCAEPGYFTSTESQAIADNAAIAAANQQFVILESDTTIFCEQPEAPCIDGDFQEVTENPVHTPETGNVNSFLVGMTYDPVEQKVFVGGQGNILVFDAANPANAPVLVPFLGDDTASSTEGVVYNPIDGLVWCISDGNNPTGPRLYTLDPVSLVLTLVYTFTNAFLTDNFGNSMLIDPVRNRLWLLGYDKAIHPPPGFGQPGYVVFDCASQLPIHQENLTSSATGTYLRGVYCRSNDSVYLFERVDSATGNIWKVNPDTYVKTLLSLGVIPEDNSDPLWIPSKNQIWFGAVIQSGVHYPNDSGWAVLDTLTDTITFDGESSISVGFGAMSYNPVQDKVYFAYFQGAGWEPGFDGGGVLLINSATYLPETNIILIPRVPNTAPFVGSTYAVSLRGGQVWVSFNNPGAPSPSAGKVWALSNCFWSSTEQCFDCDPPTGTPVCKTAGYSTSIISQSDADSRALAAATTEKVCDPAWSCPNQPEPSGANNVDADTAVNAVGGGSYTPLGPISLLECAADDMSLGNNQTFVLTLPSGWQFNTAAGDIEFTPGGDITAISLAVAATKVTITISVNDNTHIDQFIVRNLEVQPLDGDTLTTPGFILWRSDEPDNNGPGALSWPNGTIFQDSTTFGQLGTIPGKATHLTIEQQPSGTATVDTVFAQQPIVFERDQFENQCYNDYSRFVDAERWDGTGTLMGTTQVQALGGTADWTPPGLPAPDGLKHDTADTITIRFTSPGLTETISDNIVVS